MCVAGKVGGGGLSAMVRETRSLPSCGDECVGGLGRRARYVGVGWSASHIKYFLKKMLTSITHFTNHKIFVQRENHKERNNSREGVMRVRDVS